MKLVPAPRAAHERRADERFAASDRPRFTSQLVLPIAWERLEATPTGDTLAAVAEANGSALDTLLKGFDLETIRPIDKKMADALAPLRVKLDTALAMLSRLSYRDVVLPPLREVEVGLGSVAWPSSVPALIGDWLAISLYFHHEIREPVVLHGTVRSCERDVSTGEYQLQAALVEMPEGIGESFARLIFLEYRRRLAQRPERPAVDRRYV